MNDDLKHSHFARPMVPFAEGKRAEEFGRAVLQKMARRVAELQEQIMPPENVANLPHGHAWKSEQQTEEGFVPTVGELEKSSTEVLVNDERILSNDLTLVQEFIFDMAERIHNQFVKRVGEEIERTCIQSGRTTSIPKTGPVADGILSSLADIHASVDPDGNVSLPTMFLDPDLIERFKTELFLRGKELQRKAAEIRAQSEKDARDREAARVARYDRI